MFVYSKEWIVTSMLSVLFWCEFRLSFVDMYVHIVGMQGLTIVCFPLDSIVAELLVPLLSECHNQQSSNSTFE